MRRPIGPVQQVPERDLVREHDTARLTVAAIMFTLAVVGIAAMIVGAL